MAGSGVPRTVTLIHLTNLASSTKLFCFLILKVLIDCSNTEIGGWVEPVTSPTNTIIIIVTIVILLLLFVVINIIITAVYLCLSFSKLCLGRCLSTVIWVLLKVKGLVCKKVAGSIYVKWPKWKKL